MQPWRNEQFATKMKKSIQNKNKNEKKKKKRKNKIVNKIEALTHKNKQQKVVL